MKPWKIRAAISDDIPFIYSTWLKSYKYNSDFGNNIRKGVFFEQYKQVVDAILYRSNVDVACDPEEPNVILGYIVYELESYLGHYVFIKEAFRNFGIATDLYKATLMADNPVRFTHKTNHPAMEHIEEVNSNLIYDPMVLFKKE